MLENETVVVFADDWGVHPSSAQHLFRRFLEGNRVIWFDTVGQRLPRPTFGDAQKVFRKIALWARLPIPLPGAGLRRAAVAAGPGDGAGGGVEARPEVHDLPLFPVALGRAAREANARLLRRAVRARLPATGPGAGRPPFIVSTLPLTADLAGAIPGATFVYYLVDDYASWPGLAGEALRRLDLEQARRADLVVAASRALAALHEGRAGGPIEYLPHGVDLLHFAAARSRRAERRRRGERAFAEVVFFGALDERVDQGLLREVAAARPDLRFLVVGPGGRLEPALRDLGNVARLGPVDYAELPALLGRCDVALLPYARGPLVERLAPLKAREALAAGLPVVATAVPELEAHADGVRLATGAAAIAARLDEALAGEVPCPGVRDLAADSWEERAERMSEALAGARARKGRYGAAA